MPKSYRAAAFAAGAFLLCSAAGFTGPSIASEGVSTPSISYMEHAGAVSITGTLGLNELPPHDLPAGVSAPEPVAVHAAAPALPTPVPAGDEPEPRAGRSLADLVRDYAGSETPDAETDCLARAVYYESKGEPLAGQLTVAEVILNRAESGRFPATVCGVVRQRGQFSFVRGGHIPTPPQGSRDWRTAVAIAQIAVRDLADGSAPRALFFHARRVNPRWRLTRIATVGNHVFYR